MTIRPLAANPWPSWKVLRVASPGGWEGSSLGNIGPGVAEPKDPRLSRAWTAGPSAVAGIILGLAVAAMVSLLGVPGPAQEPDESGPSEEGLLIYERDCAGCHGQRGEGTGRARSLEQVGEASVDFQLSTGRMPLDRDAERPERGEPKYTQDQISQIVAAVASFGEGGEPIPEPDLAGANLEEGQTLYAVNCAACHSSTGVGAALTRGVVAPQIRTSSPVQVAEAIRVGPGQMPPFNEDTLSDDQVDDIVAYVVHLQGATDPGGHPLGRVGPVAEGLVAWAVGLGVIIAATIWMGKGLADERR